jgi:hypothetical protein
MGREYTNIKWEGKEFPIKEPVMIGSPSSVLPVD